ncbi:tetratricopeptide repeat protein [Streptomyces sp. NPDC059443]|uniref:tetratricopeptide repeat protein n=1 Tax=unclassified Streptomyces TaxID=2593676 RepID=UPI0036C00CF3
MLQHLITHDDDLRMVPANREHLAAAAEELRGDLRNRVRWIGIGLLSLGSYGEACAFLRQALDLAEASGNVRSVIATELNLGDAHRYAGETETAGMLYRDALDAARAGHPDLVDFALQHVGKHLMEQGDLVGARTHLREALQLRIAKGDADLVESTEAALDRVELLKLTDGEAADIGES